MRGWQPSIAMTSVVPERSAPIMKIGRSFSVMGISRSVLFLALNLSRTSDCAEGDLGGFTSGRRAI